MAKKGTKKSKKQNFSHSSQIRQKPDGSNIRVFINNNTGEPTHVQNDLSSPVIHELPSSDGGVQTTPTSPTDGAGPQDQTTGGADKSDSDKKWDASVKPDPDAQKKADDSREKEEKSNHQWVNKFIILVLLVGCGVLGGMYAAGTFDNGDTSGNTPIGNTPPPTGNTPPPTGNTPPPTDPPPGDTDYNINDEAGVVGMKVMGGCMIFFGFLLAIYTSTSSGQREKVEGEIVREVKGEVGKMSRAQRRAKRNAEMSRAQMKAARIMGRGAAGEGAAMRNLFK